MIGLPFALPLAVTFLTVGGACGSALIRRQGSVSPTIEFDPISDLTACSSTEIIWFWNGPTASSMSLTVANVGGSSLINKTLDPSLDPEDNSFVWDTVDIPPGNYQLTGTVEGVGYSKTSDIFNVVSGADTGCLTPASSIPLSSSTPESTIASPPPTNSGEPSEALEPIDLPPEQRLTTGAIIGIILGIAGLLFACACIFFFFRRKTPPSDRNVQGGGSGGRTGGGGGGFRKWSGLSSVDSRAGLAGPLTNPPQQRGPARRLSKLSGQQQPRTHAPAGSVATFASNSDETMPVGGSQEKYGSRKNSSATTCDEYSTMAMYTLPPVHHHEPMRNSSNSVRRPSYPDSGSVYTEGDRGRRDSRNQLNDLSNDRAISRASSLAATSVTHVGSPPQDSELASPTIEARKAANRSSFGGPKRKPVPAYDPSTPMPSLVSAKQHSPTTASPLNPLTSSPARHSMLDYESNIDHSHRVQHPVLSLPGPGHYSTRNAGQGSRAGNGEGGGSLVHKSSFGPGGVLEGTPLHYLVPDMPIDPKQRR